jgi:antirestriction protein ArdC
MSNKVYEIITNKILEQLANGVVPWKKPWANVGGDIQNFVSKKPYRGINPFLLNGSGYACPYWVTYKQAIELGGSVRKGEHGTMIVFFKMNEYKDKHDKEKVNRIPMLRYYTVFNLDQCDGIDWDRPIPVEGHNPIEAAETIVKRYKGKPEIKHGMNCASYSPQLDYINIPSMGQFVSAPEYYSTLFHELGHSTGHKDRLNRASLTESAYFGSHEYSKEELVAEFTSAMLCGVAGIEQSTIENSAAYIQSWARKLKQDNKLIVQAAAQAQKAADLIQGVQAEKALSVAA